MTRINIGRALVLTGFLVGLTSLWATFSHISDPNYLLLSSYDNGPGHARYHALREVFGSLAAMAVVLWVFFGKSQYRSVHGWWICFIVLIGYYAPYWAGIPFSAELAAPNRMAEISHGIQALATFSGLFVARKEFIAADA
jgi:Ca2+/Na+ antiporter